MDKEAPLHAESQQADGLPSHLEDQVLRAFAENELSTRATAAVQLHLAQCAECRMVLLEMMDDADSARTQDGRNDNKPAAHLPKIGETLGKYTLEGLVAQGGMGNVYAGHDPILARKVAIKVLRSDFDTEVGRARFLREARMLAQLSHPNVVSVIEFGETSGVPFIALEWIDGLTLRAWLRQSERSRADVFRCFEEIALGLVAVHAIGLVHRDLKPDNVLIDASGRCRIVDFGLARPTQLNSQITGIGEVLGTPAYMAPEQLLGNEIDARADQFSFCVCLYEAIFGRRPYHYKTYQDLFTLLHQREEVDLAATPELPPAMTTALRRGLQLKAAGRFDSMESLLSAIGWGIPLVSAIAIETPVLRETIEDLPPIGGERASVPAPPSTAILMPVTEQKRPASLKRNPSSIRLRLSMAAAALAGIAALTVTFRTQFETPPPTFPSASFAAPSEAIVKAQKTAPTPPIKTSVPEEQPADIKPLEVEEARPSLEAPRVAVPKPRTAPRRAKLTSEKSAPSRNDLLKRIDEMEKRYRSHATQMATAVDPTAIAFLSRFRSQASVGDVPPTRMVEQLSQWESQFLKP